MTTYALGFFASLAFVFLKSFQQLNVVSKQYMWITPTSLAMATMELWIVATSAKNGFEWLLVIALGLGAGLGASGATYIHDVFMKRKLNNDTRTVSTIST